MKGALIGLLTGLLVLAILLLNINIHKGESTFDIHLHDTYFIISYSILFVFAFLFLGTFFSIGGVIGSHLKSKPFWLSLVVFIVLNTYFFVKLYKTFNDAATTSSVMN